MTMKITDRNKAVVLARLLTRDEAAELLAISKRSLDRHTKAGLIPCRRIGRAVRYRFEDIRKLMS
jgi:excisionase family DNA binding protein